MPRYQRYILRQLTGPFLLATVGLTAVIWLTQALRFINYIVSKGVSLGGFAYMSMLLLPSFLGVILPVALFCAILFVYNRLVIDSEIVTLRATGLSHWSLAKPALLLTLVVVVLVYAINMYFVPVSFREFKNRQVVFRNDYTSLLLQEGVFNNLMDELTVYVRARADDGTLLGILVHDSRVAGRPITMMAESGRLVKTDRGPRFVLVNGNRQEISADRGQLSLLYFERYALDLSQLSENRGTRWRKPRERFLHELLNPSDDPNDQNNRGKFWAEAHQRIVSPLYALGLLAIAMAALLGGQFNRRGQWRRILAAILAAFAFEAIGLGLVNLVAKSTALTPLMYLNVAAVIGGSLLVLARRPRRAAPAL